MAIVYFLPGSLLVQSNLFGNIDHITDSPDNPDGLWLTAASIADIELRVGFNKSTSTLIKGVGLQTFKVWLRRTNNSIRIPIATFELYESGTFVETLASNININETTGELFTFAWDAALLSKGSGEHVEIRITAANTDGPLLEQNTVEVGGVDWTANVKGSSNWVNVEQNSTNWDVALNDVDLWSIHSEQEISNVEIEYEAATETSIAWNVSSGTIGITLNRPEIIGGVAPFTYEWRRKSGSGLMGHEGTEDDTLTLSYTGEPSQDTHDIAVESWSVFVSDAKRSRMLSNECEVELDIYKLTQPISNVSILASEYNISNIAWDNADGISSVFLDAPFVTGGFGTLEYQWSRVSGSQGFVEGTTNGATLNLQYSGDPAQDQTLSAIETWIVTVSDGYGSVLASNNCSVTLEVYRATEPISDVVIQSNVSLTENILWNALDGTANATITAPVLTGGFGPFTYQMEPATLNDLYANFLKYRPNMRALMDKYQASGLSLTDNLRMNMAFAVAAARLQYYRVPAAIPTTLEGQAAYWKKYWNTDKGKGTPDQYIEHYEKYV